VFRGVVAGAAVRLKRAIAKVTGGLSGEHFHSLFVGNS
jgi:hypothetical protein